MSDFSYARGESVKWPDEWPTLSSPLVRRGDGLIRYFMPFPSALLSELDRFLASVPEGSAVVLDGWKASLYYRWPLPNEKRWSSWTM